MADKRSHQGPNVRGAAGERDDLSRCCCTCVEVEPEPLGDLAERAAFRPLGRTYVSRAAGLKKSSDVFGITWREATSIGKNL